MIARSSQITHLGFDSAKIKNAVSYEYLSFWIQRDMNVIFIFPLDDVASKSKTLVKNI